MNRIEVVTVDQTQLLAAILLLSTMGLDKATLLLMAVDAEQQPSAEEQQKAVDEAKAAIDKAARPA